MQPLQSNFWDWVHQQAVALDDRERRIEHGGRKHVGYAKSETAVSFDYLYIGRLRPGADWPDVSLDVGEVTSLASTGFQGQLIEPAYLLGVSGTNYVALVRSSAGPSTSAIERWLNQICGFPAHSNRLELRPYLRKDQLERLARAQGATKLNFKVEPDAFQNSLPADPLGKALQAAQDTGAGGVAVDLTLSFGNARPTDLAGGKLVAALRKMLESSYSYAIRKASATVLVPNEEGELVRDQIDFVKDRVTIQQQVGTNDDDEPKPSLVLEAMASAISEFRKNL